MDKLRAIGDRDLRATLLFARIHGDAVTADDVASAQGIHRNVARARLERLAQAGLLVPAFERRTGKRGPGAGRPAKTYRVPPETSALEFPKRYYERLIGLFADALPDSKRSAHLHDIGVAFGAELARQAGVRRTRRFGRALERVCSALGRLGYHASLTEIEGDRAVITTATCPLRPLVCTDPQLAGLDRGMWTGLLEAALGPSDPRTIACETTSCSSEATECRVHLLLPG